MILAKILFIAVLFGIIMIFIRLRARRESPGGAYGTGAQPTATRINTVKAGKKNFLIPIGSAAANPARLELNADQKAVCDAMAKLLSEGKLIKAVQFMRQHSNSSLKEAVAAVKEMQLADETRKQNTLGNQHKP